MDELILIEKNGEQIRVHPGTLENHKLLGWIEVEAVAAETPDPDPAPEPVVGATPSARPESRPETEAAEISEHIAPKPKGKAAKK